MQANDSIIPCRNSSESSLVSKVGNKTSGISINNEEVTVVRNREILEHQGITCRKENTRESDVIRIASNQNSSSASQSMNDIEVNFEQMRENTRKLAENGRKKVINCEEVHCPDISGELSDSLVAKDEIELMIEIEPPMEETNDRNFQVMITNIEEEIACKKKNCKMKLIKCGSENNVAKRMKSRKKSAGIESMGEYCIDSDEVIEIVENGRDVVAVPTETNCLSTVKSEKQGFKLQEIPKVPKLGRNISTTDPPTDKSEKKLRVKKHLIGLISPCSVVIQDLNVKKCRRGERRNISRKSYAEQKANIAFAEKTFGQTCDEENGTPKLYNLPEENNGPLPCVKASKNVFIPPEESVLHPIVMETKSKQGNVCVPEMKDMLPQSKKFLDEPKFLQENPMEEKHEENVTIFPEIFSEEIFNISDDDDICVEEDTISVSNTGLINNEPKASTSANKDPFSISTNKLNNSIAIAKNNIKSSSKKVEINNGKVADNVSGILISPETGADFSTVDMDISDKEEQHITGKHINHQVVSTQMPFQYSILEFSPKTDDISRSKRMNLNISSVDVNFTNHSKHTENVGTDSDDTRKKKKTKHKHKHKHKRKQQKKYFKGISIKKTEDSVKSGNVKIDIDPIEESQSIVSHDEVSNITKNEEKRENVKLSLSIKLLTKEKLSCNDPEKCKALEEALEKLEKLVTCQTKETIKDGANVPLIMMYSQNVGNTTSLRKEPAYNFASSDKQSDATLQKINANRMPPLPTDVTLPSPRPLPPPLPSPKKPSDPPPPPPLPPIARSNSSLQTLPSFPELSIVPKLPLPPTYSFKSRLLIDTGVNSDYYQSPEMEINFQSLNSCPEIFAGINDVRHDVLPHTHQDGFICTEMCRDARRDPSNAYFKFPHRHSDGTLCQTQCQRLINREKWKKEEILSKLPTLMLPVDMPWRLIPVDIPMNTAHQSTLSTLANAHLKDDDPDMGNGKQKITDEVERKRDSDKTDVQKNYISYHDRSISGPTATCVSARHSENAHSNSMNSINHSVNRVEYITDMLPPSYSSTKSSQCSLDVFGSSNISANVNSMNNTGKPVVGDGNQTLQYPSMVENNLLQCAIKKNDKDSNKHISSNIPQIPTSASSNVHLAYDPRLLSTDPNNRQLNLPISTVLQSNVKTEMMSFPIQLSDLQVAIRTEGKVQGSGPATPTIDEPMMSGHESTLRKEELIIYGTSTSTVDEPLAYSTVPMSTAPLVCRVPAPTFEPINRRASTPTLDEPILSPILTSTTYRPIAITTGNQSIVCRISQASVIDKTTTCCLSASVIDPNSSHPSTSIKYGTMNQAGTGVTLNESNDQCRMPTNVACNVTFIEDESSSDSDMGVTETSNCSDTSGNFKSEYDSNCDDKVKHSVGNKSSVLHGGVTDNERKLKKELNSNSENTKSSDRCCTPTRDEPVDSLIQLSLPREREVESKHSQQLRGCMVEQNTFLNLNRSMGIDPVMVPRLKEMDSAQAISFAIKHDGAHAIPHAIKQALVSSLDSVIKNLPKIQQESILNYAAGYFAALLEKLISKNEDGRSFFENLPNMIHWAATNAQEAYTRSLLPIDESSKCRMDTRVLQYSRDTDCNPVSKHEDRNVKNTSINNANDVKPNPGPKQIQSKTVVSDIASHISHLRKTCNQTHGKCRQHVDNTTKDSQTAKDDDIKVRVPSGSATKLTDPRKKIISDDEKGLPLLPKQKSKQAYGPILPTDFPNIDTNSCLGDEGKTDSRLQNDNRSFSRKRGAEVFSDDAPSLPELTAQNVKKKKKHFNRNTFKNKANISQQSNICTSIFNERIASIKSRRLDTLNKIDNSFVRRFENTYLIEDDHMLPSFIGKSNFNQRRRYRSESSISVDSSNRNTSKNDKHVRFHLPDESSEETSNSETREDGEDRFHLVSFNKPKRDRRYDRIDGRD